MIAFIFETLRGWGFFHPLHPAVTHLPMGLVMAGLIFVTAGIFFRQEKYIKTAYHCAVLALISIPLAALLGIMDWQYTMKGQWIAPIKYKMFLATGLTVSLLLLIKFGKPQGRNSKIMLSLFILSLIFAINLGYFGGSIIFG